MGNDKQRRERDEDDNDSNRLQYLAKLLRGIKPKQRNKFHDRKPKKDRPLRDVANDYNATGKIEEE